MATSDGSQCGVTQGIAPSTRLSYTQQSAIGQLISAEAHILRGDISAYALPAYGQQATISFVRLIYSYTLFVGIPLTILKSLRWDEAPSPPNTLPYENLPGGTALLNESADCANKHVFGFVPAYASLTQTTFYGGSICFVPTYSALDAEPATPADAYASYVNNLVTTANRPTPARFVAQAHQAGNTGDYNLTHLQYTARNGEWIFNEMQRPFNSSDNVVGCSPECSPVSFAVSGPAVLCAGGSTTYTVAGPLPAGATVEWTATPAGQVVFTPSGTSVVATPGPGFTPGTQATLHATVKTPCPVPATSLAVLLGRGYVLINDGDGTHPPQCAVPDATFTVTEQAGTQGPYTWTANYGTINGQGSSQLRLTNLPYADYVLTVTVSAPDDCGGAPLQASYSREYRTQLSPGMACEAYRPTHYEVYPNPASDEVAVTREDDGATAQRGGATAGSSSSSNSSGSSAPGGGGRFTVRLFDVTGLLRHTAATSTGQLRLRVGSLPVGLYLLFLTDLDTGTIVRRQLEVAR